MEDLAVKRQKLHGRFISKEAKITQTFNSKDNWRHLTVKCTDPIG